MSRGDIANNYFCQGYNCSQAVAMAFEDMLDMDAKSIARAISGFGGGISRMREVCGTFSGVCIVLGLLCGFDGENGISKAEHYALIRKLGDKFKADNGSIIPADVRFSTDFTDTSIRNTTLLMNVKGKMFKSHRNWTFAPNTLEGTLELKSNPLLEGKTEDEIQAIIDNIQDYTDDLRFCPFKTTFNGNPAIEVGDFVYLEPGGAIDEIKYRHYGIVTYSKWVYRGKCEIRCAADMTAERPSTTAAASAKSANGMMRAAPKAASDVFGVQPKSQLEKKIDALSGAGDASALVFKPLPNVRLEFKSPTDLHMMNGDEEIFNIFGNTSTDNTRLLRLNVINTANVVINDSNLEIKWANGARLLLYANNGAVFFEGSETIPGTNRKYNWEINTYEGEIRINGKKVTL